LLLFIKEKNDEKIAFHLSLSFHYPHTVCLFIDHTTCVFIKEKEEIIFAFAFPVFIFPGIPKSRSGWMQSLK